MLNGLGKEDKKGKLGQGEAGPHWASREGEKIIPKFLCILGRRQTEKDNKCQSSRPGEKHLKKKKGSALH